MSNLKKEVMLLLNKIFNTDKFTKIPKTNEERIKLEYYKHSVPLEKVQQMFREKIKYKCGKPYHIWNIRDNDDCLWQVQLESIKEVFNV